MPDQTAWTELAETPWAEQPGLRVIFTCGCHADVAGTDLALRRGLSYPQKPYHPRQLALAVRD
jgi:hypothetical protein